MGGGGGGGGFEQNNLVSLRPNYFIFIGYLKTGGGMDGGFEQNNLVSLRPNYSFSFQPPLDLPLPCFTAKVKKNLEI